MTHITEMKLLSKILLEAAEIAELQPSIEAAKKDLFDTNARFLLLKKEADALQAQNDEEANKAKIALNSATEEAKKRTKTSQKILAEAEEKLKAARQQARSIVEAAYNDLAKYQKELKDTQDNLAHARRRLAGLE